MLGAQPKQPRKFAAVFYRKRLGIPMFSIRITAKNAKAAKKSDQE
jgi:hypothetical protein